MSLFESSITGNLLNDGSTTEISGITAGQLAAVLTAYTPLTATATNTTSISANATGVANNATAIAALQTQVDNPPTPPDLPPCALASDLAARPTNRRWTRCSSRWTPRARRPAPGLQQHGGHEFGHHQRQQRNPGQRGVKLHP